MLVQYCLQIPFTRTLWFGGRPRLLRRGDIPRRRTSCGANSKLQVVFVSTEVTPWSKTGGLGDVVAALPGALAARGHRVMTVSPFYANYPTAFDTGLVAPVEMEVQVGAGDCQMQPAVPAAAALGPLSKGGVQIPPATPIDSGGIAGHGDPDNGAGLPAGRQAGFPAGDAGQYNATSGDGGSADSSDGAGGSGVQQERGCSSGRGPPSGAQPGLGVQQATVAAASQQQPFTQETERREAAEKAEGTRCTGDQQPQLPPCSSGVQDSSTACPRDDQVSQPPPDTGTASPAATPATAVSYARLFACQDGDVLRVFVDHPVFRVAAAASSSSQEPGFAPHAAAASGGHPIPAAPSGSSSCGMQPRDPSLGVYTYCEGLAHAELQARNSVLCQAALAAPVLLWCDLSELPQELRADIVAADAVAPLPPQALPYVLHRGLARPAAVLQSGGADRLRGAMQLRAGVRRRMRSSFPAAATATAVAAAGGELIQVAAYDAVVARAEVYAGGVHAWQPSAAGKSNERGDGTIACGQPQARFDKHARLVAAGGPTQWVVEPKSDSPGATEAAESLRTRQQVHPHPPQRQDEVMFVGNDWPTALLPLWLQVYREAREYDIPAHSEPAAPGSCHGAGGGGQGGVGVPSHALDEVSGAAVAKAASPKRCRRAQPLPREAAWAVSPQGALAYPTGGLGAQVSAAPVHVAARGTSAPPASAAPRVAAHTPAAGAPGKDGRSIPVGLIQAAKAPAETAAPMAVVAAVDIGAAANPRVPSAELKGLTAASCCAAHGTQQNTDTGPAAAMQPQQSSLLAPASSLLPNCMYPAAAPPTPLVAVQPLPAGSCWLPLRSSQQQPGGKQSAVASIPVSPSTSCPLPEPSCSIGLKSGSASISEPESGVMWRRRPRAKAANDEHTSSVAASGASRLDCDKVVTSAAISAQPACSPSGHRKPFSSSVRLVGPRSGSSGRCELTGGTAGTAELASQLASEHALQGQLLRHVIMALLGVPVVGTDPAASDAAAAVEIEEEGACMGPPEPKAERHNSIGDESAVTEIAERPPALPLPQQPRGAAPELQARMRRTLRSFRRFLGVRLRGARVVFAIHNLAFQGLFPEASARRLGLPLPVLQRMELRSGQEPGGGGGGSRGGDGGGSSGRGGPGRLVSWLKAALLSSDLLVTVSPSYARELVGSQRAWGEGTAGLPLQPPVSQPPACSPAAPSTDPLQLPQAFQKGSDGISVPPADSPWGPVLSGLPSPGGEELCGILAARGVQAVMNGLDVTCWDPETDPLLPSHLRYSRSSAREGKARAKAALQARLGLQVDPGVPVFGFVGRLEQQKGVDVVLAALPLLLGEPAEGAGYNCSLGCDRRVAKRVVELERVRGVRMEAAERRLSAGRRRLLMRRGGAASISAQSALGCSGVASYAMAAETGVSGTAAVSQTVIGTSGNMVMASDNSISNSTEATGCGSRHSGMRLQVALLGQGEQWLQDSLAALQGAYPGRAAGVVGFDEALSRLLLAGCDFLLLPSRWEPCGLVALAGLRYGAVPLVAPVGGLRDVVAPATPGVRRQVERGGSVEKVAEGAVKAANAVGGLLGIVLDRPVGQHDDSMAKREAVGSLTRAMTLACSMYGMEAYDGLRDQCMAQDVSWGAPAEQWEELLRRAVAVGPEEGGPGVAQQDEAWAGVDQGYCGRGKCRAWVSRAGAAGV
ncbi:hypothetical protein Agub_g4156 [Astrephomene gubernaculifera]|uniref:Starch synthase catalytic domain-containing protein n=1 Tax=Astrephomene gubernaculifera TaxID=47775 RepID=A0AAD3DJS7_9CHLO|nr:hypothetical protein Agub_g4156 [Astrephomene gubernaculifera]